MSEDDEMSEEAHGPTEALWDNLRKECALDCCCGEMCRGDTWEEAGAAMDQHLEEARS